MQHPLRALVLRLRSILQDLVDQCPAPVLALMRKMWASKPSDRPSMVCNFGDGL